MNTSSVRSGETFRFAVLQSRSPSVGSLRKHCLNFPLIVHTFARPITRAEYWTSQHGSSEIPTVDPRGSILQLFRYLRRVSPEAHVAHISRLQRHPDLRQHGL